jgi:hypothetical protein
LQKDGVEIGASLQESAPGSQTCRQAYNLTVDAVAAQKVQMDLKPLPKARPVRIVCENQ